MRILATAPVLPAASSEAAPILPTVSAEVERDLRRQNEQLCETIATLSRRIEALEKAPAPAAPEPAAVPAPGVSAADVEQAVTLLRERFESRLSALEAAAAEPRVEEPRIAPSVIDDLAALRQDLDALTAAFQAWKESSAAPLPSAPPDRPAESPQPVIPAKAGIPGSESIVLLSGDSRFRGNDEQKNAAETPDEVSDLPGLDLPPFEAPRPSLWTRLWTYLNEPALSSRR